MTMRAVDCQGFAGGFTLGVVQSGFELVGKREMPAGFGVANCEANRHLLGSTWDTETVDPAAWSVPVGGAEFVFGNPPCSGFSGLSIKEFRGVDSPINHCMWAFVEYAARVRPLVAAFESVRAAYTKGHSLMRDLRARLEARTGTTWTLYHVVHDAYALGGPAVRRRYFWVAARVPFGVEHPELPGVPTLWDAIQDLESLEQRWDPQSRRGEPSDWALGYRNGKFPSRLGSATLVDGQMPDRSPWARRLVELATWIDWEHGKSVSWATRTCWERYGTLPPSWESIQASIVQRDFTFGFSGSVARWYPDRPARVVTGAGPSIAIHPTLPRVLTHREVARLMGFPDDWLAEPIHAKLGQGLRATWGKGITVDAGRWLAHWVRRSIEGSPGGLPSKVVGPREHELVVARPLTCDTVDTQLVPREGRATVAQPTAPVPPAPIDPTAQAATTTAVAAPPAAPAASAEAPAAPAEGTAAEGKKGRGRGRPAHTVERDNLVLSVLSENGLTREQITDALRDQIEPDNPALRSTRVYQSLVRLTWESNGSLVERVRDGRTHVWRRTGNPVPAA